MFSSRSEVLYVIDRHNRRVPIDFAKIQQRITNINNGYTKDGSEIGPPLPLNPLPIIQSVISGVQSNMHTREIDEMSASIANNLSLRDTNYNILASRLIISNHHENTVRSFSDLMEDLFNNTDDMNNSSPLISQELYRVSQKYREQLDAIIDNKRDFEHITYFGFITLQKSYLLKTNHQPRSYRLSQERPQHMFLRVALGIHLNSFETTEEDIEAAKNTYDIMSRGYMIHATPTLFNAGTQRPQLSSCFLLGTQDNIEGLFKTQADCASISKWAGGIGLHVSNVRGEGALIRSTNGRSSGLVPMIKVYDEISRWINQGGKRNGSIAIYLEPWHPDIEDWLELKRITGVEQRRARNLFYGLMIPSLFMNRIREATSQSDPAKQNSVLWSLFDPDTHQNLTNLYGAQFNEAYLEAESSKSFVRQVPILQIWRKLLAAQQETSIPYMLYKDAINLKSNQKNIGTIRSSNLCTEIVEYSDHNEYAVCNLASIALPRFLNLETKTFDYKLLGAITEQITINLNKIIDRNYYPTIETKRSNLRHRPIGIGVQGLADLFMMLHLPFDSPEARELNINIFQTIYYHSTLASSNIAKERTEDLAHLILALEEGRLTEIDEFTIALNPTYEESEDSATAPLTDEDLQELLDLHKPIPYELSSKPDRRPGAYSTFEGSPASQGLLQPDLWEKHPPLLETLDWPALRTQVKTYGLRNSLLVAPMPTASTSSILGNIESFEPIKENIYTRKTLGGQFIIANQYLCEDLKSLDLWTPQIIEKIKERRGSIQGIEEIPQALQQIYRTAFEIKPKSIIDMAADRAPFIDQSQSLNLFISNPTDEVLTAIHLYTHDCGLKTGSYYIRRKPVVDALQHHTLTAPPPPTPSPSPPSFSEKLIIPKLATTPIKKLESECPPGCTSCEG